jgi:hypothetical protein
MRCTLILLGAALALSGDSPPAGRAPSGLLPAPAAGPLRLSFLQDLAAARKQAAASGKPLVVFSVLGDCHKHC